MAGGLSSLPRHYAGHRMQATLGLYYMQARWMDPASGTFLSVDPLIGNAFDPQSQNSFAYARNNSITFDDPSGACIRLHCVNTEFVASTSMTVSVSDLETGAPMGTVTLTWENGALASINGNMGAISQMNASLANTASQIAKGTQFASASGGPGFSPDSRFVGGSIDQMNEATRNLPPLERVGPIYELGDGTLFASANRGSGFFGREFGTITSAGKFIPVNAPTLPYFGLPNAQLAGIAMRTLANPRTRSLLTGTTFSSNRYVRFGLSRQGGEGTIRLAISPTGVVKLDFVNLGRIPKGGF